jgi:hypothetical protein
MREKVLLGGATVVVERQQPLVREAAIGDDEADRREQFARVELYLGHDPAGLGPTLRPVMETGVEAHNVMRRPAWAALRQPVDPFMQLRIALDADGVVPAFGLQQVKEGRDGEGRIGPEPPPFDRGPGGG